MEEYSSRRSKTAIGFLRRGSGISSRYRSPEERTIQNCDAPGSRTRFNHMKTRLADNQDRPKYLRDSSKSSTSMVLPGSSSKVSFRKFGEEKQRQYLSAGVDIAESSSRKAGTIKHLEGSKRIAVTGKSSDARQTESEGLDTEKNQTVVALDPGVPDSASSSDISAPPVESLVRSAALSSRTHRQKDKELNLGQSGASSSSCTNRPTISSQSRYSVTDPNPPYGHVNGVQRHGLRNTGCTSVSSFVPSGCSSDSVHSRRFDAMRKRASDGGSSSRPGCLSGPVSLGHSPPAYPAVSGSRIRTTSTEQVASRQTIRSRSNNFQDSAVSVRTRRPSPSYCRFRICEEREDGMFCQNDSASGNQQSDQMHLSLEEASSESSSRPLSVELPHAIYSSSRPGTNTCTARRRSSSFFEERPPQTFHDLLRERGGHRRIAIEGIAEVLLALDRFEQEAELTYEQLLVLETNLLLGAFASHDQHSDMRMDIDNMSYEELLALEERIGSVSTALSEEQFVKCLRRSIYRTVDIEANNQVIDDIKCSICQEEYIVGEEVGRLGCEHQYHVCCIHQWFKQKNWCPICKASAEPHTSMS